MYRIDKNTISLEAFFNNDISHCSQQMKVLIFCKI